MDFAEYAALARHLSELHRAREQRAGQAAGYRAATEAGIAQLGHRLASQQQRLAELAQTIGEPAPRGGPPLPVPPTPPPGQPGQPGQFGYPGHLAGPPGQPPLPGPPPTAAPGPYAGNVHPGGGLAYPELPAGPARIALPATPVSGAGPRPVPAPTAGAGSWPPPAPRRPPDAADSPAGGTHPGSPAGGSQSGVGTPDAAPPDPGQELELARQAADAADQEAMRAEALATQPALLPTWSPLLRAVVVYLGCTLLMLLVQFTLMGQVLRHQLDSFAFVAWSFAGLPAVAFIGGFLVLNTWGKARLGPVPPRYPRLGFLICFLGTPIGYCLTTL